MKIYARQTVSSTQDIAFELLDQGEPGPFVVTCEEQTMGRGRQGRSWAFEKGKSLALSYGVVKTDTSLQGLSLVVGLSLVKAVGHESLRLKWPNDLMLVDEKVGGILVEVKSQGPAAQIVVGVGLNLFHLTSYSGVGLTIESEWVAEEMNRHLNLFWDKGFSYFRQAYHEKLWRKGLDIMTTLDGRKERVVVVDIDNDGCLLVERERVGKKCSLEKLSSGEIFL